MKKISALLKPGGTLMSYCCRRKMDEITVHFAGTKPYQILHTNAEFVTDVLQRQGFTDIDIKVCMCSEYVIKHAYTTSLIGF